MIMFTILAVLACLAQAATLATQIEAPTPIEERDSACTHGPLTRACWSDGFSIATDFDLKFPVTSNIVQYNLVITNGTCNPDGNGNRQCFLVNGQYPGPQITANWGDRLQVTVQNNLAANGTSIHWHGVRQLDSVGSDGVSGITECPIAPGTSTKYDFLVTQFGTSWYHSHFSSQYGDGIVGPLVFNGPASANYDIDLGPYAINDWFYKTTPQLEKIILDNLQRNVGPPPGDTILINGTNKNVKGGGNYNQVRLTKGKKYRLRLINMSLDNYIRVSLDKHVFQVITADFVPVKPFYTDWILISIGQRYDVVIFADQTAGNYWFRAEPATDCSSTNNFPGRAIFSYDNVTVATPTTSAANFVADCIEPLPSPFWKQPVPNGNFSSIASSLNVGLTRAQAVPGGDTVVLWALNASSMNVAWEKPTLSYIMDGNSSYPPRLNIIPILSKGNWNYWLIQQASQVPPIPHPIHLHGHDFFVLGQGSSRFDSNAANLNWLTPPRRDTASVYSNGWLALAFTSNNPGTWLMHCHIAWHISEGLGVQFLESPSSIILPNRTMYQNQCDAWAKYQAGMPYPKMDSGL